MRLQFNSKYVLISLLLPITVLSIAGSAMGTVTCPGPSTLQGVDVSQFNGTIDWSTVAASGIKFAYASVSDGTTLDVTFDANYSGIKAAGLARGAYQFFRPAQDPAAQATLLLQKIGTLRAGDLPPALDVEVTDGQSAATIIANIQTWVTAVQNATGRPPIVLTGSFFWNGAVGGSSSFAGDPLWILNWLVVCPNLPSAWNNWTFWNYRPNGSVPGIPAFVDLDEFNGSLADLRELSIVPFASFHAAVQVDEDAFATEGSFSLGIANHAIDPLHEDTTIQVASFSTTIPAVSFKETPNGQFYFAGIINGVSLEAGFLPVGGSRFVYIVAAQGVNMNGTTNPVTVTLTIGNQRGTAITNAQFED